MAKSTGKNKEEHLAQHFRASRDPKETVLIEVVGVEKISGVKEGTSTRCVLGRGWGLEISVVGTGTGVEVSIRGERSGQS